MNTLLKVSSLVLLCGALLALSGCLLGPNMVLEGPDGLMALVLEDDGAYEMLPEGGALWLLEADGTPKRMLLSLGEEKDARAVDWTREGDALLVLLSDVGEFGFPEMWRLIHLPLDGEPVELLVSEDPIMSARFGDGGEVLFTLAEDEGVSLIGLDPELGEERLLAEDVLAFHRWDGGLYVLGTDGVLRQEDGEELPLQTQCLGEDCDFGMSLWPSLYLDVSPDGRYVAIVLEQEPRLLLPEAEGEPALYLVDLETSMVTYLATPGLCPSFASDGSALAFISEPPDGPEQVYIYDLTLGYTSALEETEHAAWVRWEESGLVVALHEAFAYELRRWADDTWTVLNVGAQQ